MRAIGSCEHNSLGRLFLTLPASRDKLRRVLILDQPDRDTIASELLRYGDDGDGWTGVIDTLSMHPDVRRRMVRLLADIDATDLRSPSGRTPGRDVPASRRSTRHQDARRS